MPTIAQLKETLTSRGIKFGHKMKKAQLQALLDGNGEVSRAPAETIETNVTTITGTGESSPKQQAETADSQQPKETVIESSATSDDNSKETEPTPVENKKEPEQVVEQTEKTEKTVVAKIPAEITPRVETPSENWTKPKIVAWMQENGYNKLKMNKSQLLQRIQNGEKRIAAAKPKPSGVMPPRDVHTKTVSKTVEHVSPPPSPKQRAPSPKQRAPSPEVTRPSTLDDLFVF